MVFLICHTFFGLSTKPSHRLCLMVFLFLHVFKGLVELVAPDSRFGFVLAATPRGNADGPPQSLRGPSWVG